MHKESRKIKLLLLMDIFNKLTDDEHHLTAKQLCNELKNYGITSERKSIYNDINTLISFGIDVNKSPNPKKGFFLAKREFELPELKILIDFIYSCPLITERKSESLVNKLKNMVSIYETEQIDKNTIFSTTYKSNNEEVYYSIDTINRAINSKKSISFIYKRRIISNGHITLDDGKLVTLTPIYFAWINNNYYIIGINEENYNYYRIDKIKSVCILNGKVCSNVTIKNIDANNHTKNKKPHINPNEIETLELICKNCILERMPEQLTNNIKIINHGSNYFTAIFKVNLTNSFINWLLVNGDIIYVKSPDYLREEILKKASDIILNHKSPPYKATNF